MAGSDGDGVGRGQTSEVTALDWSAFLAVVEGRSTVGELRGRLGRDDLQGLTAKIFDVLVDGLTAATDATVTFVARDPRPEAPEAKGWTLGHLVAHVTAGLDEGAANAVTLARGIAPGERLRYETPWKAMDSVEKVRGRLAESRRMCLAFLEAWPDEPHLEVRSTLVPGLGELDAVGWHLVGIMHAVGHLAQMREIRRQAGE